MAAENMSNLSHLDTFPRQSRQNDQSDQIVQNPDNLRTLSSVMSELGDSLGTIMRSEAHLIKAEIKENASLISAHGTQIIVFGIVILFGALPLVAFLVLGLGRLMNDNYIASSFIVGAVLTGLGIAGVLRAVKNIKEEDFSFPHVRESLGTQKEILNRKLHDVYETIQRRAS